LTVSQLSVFRRKIGAPVVAVVAPVYLAGCFHYVPVDASLTPAAGTDIRATLSTPQPFNLGALTVNSVESVEGTLVGASPDSLGVWVKWLYPAVGEKVDANRVQFYLQRGNLTRLEEWRVSSKATVVAVAATVGVVGAMLGLVSLARNNSGGSGSANPPPIGAQIHFR
jgi:hypothetical protein